MNEPWRELDIVVAGAHKVYTGHRGVIRRTRFENVALAGVDLQVRRGELFGLLGPNGAGKTTLVKILTTLLLPTAGRAEVAGLDVVRSTAAVRRRIGFVLGGDRGLYTRASASQNLRYFADLYRVPPAVARRRVPELLELFGLSGRAHDRVELFSRGMKQRLHLARGLVHDPDVLFLDEPTNGLDPVGAHELRALIRQLTARGKTVFMTTHQLFEADAVCDRIAVIIGGTIISRGTPADLKRQVADLGVVELQIDGAAPAAVLESLRRLRGVSAVAEGERDGVRLVTIRCAQPVQVATRIPPLLDGLPLHGLAVREPTLEDAYLRLVGGDAAG